MFIHCLFSQNFNSKLEIKTGINMISSTCAFGTALPGSGDGSGAGRGRAHLGDAGDAASEAGAAAAGVGGGCEGLAMTVHDALVQAGVAHWAAGV